VLELTQAPLVGSGAVQWALGSWTSCVSFPGGGLSLQKIVLSRRSHRSKATACPTDLLLLFPAGVLTAGEHSFPFQFLLPGMVQMNGWRHFPVRLGFCSCSSCAEQDLGWMAEAGWQLGPEMLEGA